jgi:hypothetical protein
MSTPIDPNVYQPRHTTLTKLTTVPLSANRAGFRLALNADGTDFVWVAPDTNQVPEGGNNLYFTTARARAAINGAASTVLTANLPLSRVLISNSTGKIVSSAITAVELGYLGGVTTAIQPQLTALATTINNLAASPRTLATITGAVSNITTINLPAAKVLVSDVSGKVVVGNVTSAEVDHLSGVTANVQTQLWVLNNRIGALDTTGVVEGTNQYFTSARAISAITGAASSITSTDLSPGKALVSDANGKVKVSDVSMGELGHLSGATSNLQTQLLILNNRVDELDVIDTSSIEEGTNQYYTSARAVAAITGGASTITTTNLSTSRALVSDNTGKVSASSVTTTELGYLTGTTSAIQTQINTITGRAVTVGPGMTGGGSLSSNISLSLSFDASTSNIKMAGAVSLGTLNTVPRADHVHPSDTSKVNTSLMGVASGVATLDSNAKVPTAQIPAMTTQVGFGGEVISVPYTGTAITLPLPVSQGGTGTTTSTGALSALGGQPLSPILTTISSTTSSGFLIKDAAGIAQIRSLQVGTPLTITNPSGLAGNPTISLSQGHGSGLDADLLDGAHGSAYFKTDGTVTYSTGTASTIRGSISAASRGANTDITSLGTVTGLGNGSTSHITITSTGMVGIGEPAPGTLGYGNVAIRGGVAGTNTSTLSVATPNGNNLRASISLCSTFSNYPIDTLIRRTADIIAGFNGGVWGTEYLSLNVGSAGTNNLTTERLRIDGSGNVLVGTTSTTAGGGDVQVSKGLTFPSVQVPCSNVNTLDDYREGTWIPVIDSSTPGTGRVTTVYYATFTKVGNMVTFSAYVWLSTIGTGGSGGLVINGLPYTSTSGGGQAYIPASVPYFSALKAAVMSLGATVEPNSKQILFRGYSTAISSVPALDFNTYLQAGSNFIVSGFYYV